MLNHLYKEFDARLERSLRAMYIQNKAPHIFKQQLAMNSYRKSDWDRYRKGFSYPFESKLA